MFKIITMPSQDNTINVLQNSHSRNPLAHSVGHRLGVESQFYIFFYFNRNLVVAVLFLDIRLIINIVHVDTRDLDHDNEYFILTMPMQK